jgi:hypothetical protein
VDALSPTWVSIAGYALEKIHTGVIAHSLNRGTAESRSLLAALWQHATGSHIDPSQMSNVVVAPEERVGDGPDSVIDLLVGFDAESARHRLGFELKVDSPPRAEQVTSELSNIREKRGSSATVILLSLGAAQVCAAGPMPTGAARWDAGDILAFRDAILRAASADDVVLPWLNALEFERTRRVEALGVRKVDSARRGYRSRTLEAYKLAAIAERLQGHRTGPWNVNILPHNVVAHAVGSRVTRTLDSADATVYVELTDQALTVKASSRPGIRDLQTRLAPVTAELRRALHDRIDLTPTRTREGSAATLLQSTVDLDEPDAVAEAVMALADAWELVGRAIVERAVSPGVA